MLQVPGPQGSLALSSFGLRATGGPITVDPTEKGNPHGPNKENDLIAVRDVRGKAVNGPAALRHEERHAR